MTMLDTETEVDSTNTELSPIMIGITVLSVIAGMGLIGISLLLIRRIRSNNVKNMSSLNTVPIANNNNNTSRNIFRNPFHRTPASTMAPVTSSLDSHEIFFSILEYPPTKPPISKYDNRLNEHGYSIHGISPPTKSLDPISASLVRQSIEGRAGYYKSPTRTPIPYYNHSAASSSSTQQDPHVELADEEKQMMQRWSSSSYHVW
ncbi:hypothetical protein BDB01DRAFT_782749 [Pilobolus umbonatus]|nr:hypothetical protein BDB01DRAFT_782749 [Pilobolus umbonatus]